MGVLRLWILAASALLAVAGGQSELPEKENRPPVDEARSDHDHDGHQLPFGGHHEHDGHGHDRDENGGDGGDRGPIGGKSGVRGDGEHGPVSPCTSEESDAAVEASTDYVTCTGLSYGDLYALVHADFELLEGAVTCFGEKVEELQKQGPDENGEIEVDVENLFEECVDEVESTDESKTTAATAEFLNKMLGPDSKVCSCLPAFVDQMPHCDVWQRSHRLGNRLEDLCESVDTAQLPFPGPEDLPSPAGQAPGKTAEVTAATTVAEPNPNHGVEQVMKEEPYGPCGPGKEVDPNDPGGCQPAHTPQEESYFNAPEDRDDRGPPPEGGGILGLGLSVLGVVAVGGVIGIGGVYAWGKFQSGTRQPGVRYMATGDNDIGTELGPFGREYP